MLNNILINAGQYTEIAKQGKFLNVVLAAGEIEVRLRLRDGSTFQTMLVSGMSFSLPSGFVSAAFVSDTSQQTKIWLSDLPLTYAPMESKVVGSSSVFSETAQVFSGQETLLLAAKAGRNKITVQPVADIKIGGVGVTSSKGITVKANEVFTLKTQGAIYAIEESGQYQPTYTAYLTADEINNPVVLAGKRCGMALSPDGKTLFATSGTNIYSYDVATNTQKSITNNIGTISGYHVNQNGDYLEFAGGNTWNRLNMVTMEYVKENFRDTYLGGVEFSTTDGGSRFCVDADYNCYFYDGMSWAVKSPVPVLGYIYGTQIDTNGDIYVVSASQVAKSTNSGGAWSVVAAPATIMGELALAIDKLSGVIYLAGSKTLFSSVDGGVTWESELSGLEGNIVAVQANYGTVVVTTKYGVYFKFESDSQWYFYDEYLQQARGLLISQGYVFVGSAKKGLLRFEGRSIAKNGLVVAVMSEVN
jgi:hypothetical protein